MPITKGFRALVDEAMAQVTTHSVDQVRQRLDDPALQLVDIRDARELEREGMVPGAIEIPANGQPVLFMRDQPVTGGYPVIAIVTDASLDALWQARPGTAIRFRHARPAG